MDISRVTGSLANIVNDTQTNANNDIDFKEIISDELNRINDMHVHANEMTEQFISGEIDDLHTVMIATEEARLSFELAVQIRNKLVESYKEINNMQL
ncbi:MAG: flagellar hook-basal body complex protein FliE [Tissierellia bacterium]|nr:flagellar hook-basal body complex protein FliE [Tissierellia bacterium]